MIENVLDSVLQAEDKAEEIKSTALLDAKNKIATAEEQALKIKDAGLLKAKSNKRIKTEKAKSLAQKDYESGISACEKQCEEFVYSMQEKANALSDILVEKVLDGSSTSL